MGSLGSSFLARPYGQALRIVSRMCWRSSVLPARPYSNALVSIGLGCRIGVASKILFYLLSCIYSSFAKLKCENYRETQWEGKYPLPVSSTKRYFKMQSVHGPSIYRTIPSAQYKPQHYSYATLTPLKTIRSFAAIHKPQLEPTIMDHRGDVQKYAIPDTMGVTKSIAYLQNCLAKSAKQNEALL